MPVGRVEDYDQIADELTQACGTLDLYGFEMGLDARVGLEQVSTKLHDQVIAFHRRVSIREEFETYGQV